MTNQFRTSPQIIALVYSDGAIATRFMRRLVDELRATDANIAGCFQYDVVQTGRTRCDMVLEDVATGSRMAISDNRGPGARGCQLDTDCLAMAFVKLRGSLTRTTDLLILNKFGKSEAEGGGFRPLIADAIELGIPIVLGVPVRNVVSWRAFASEFSREVNLDHWALVQAGSMCAALGVLDVAPVLKQVSAGGELSDGHPS